MNYYNEKDQVACAVLRELIAANIISNGVVDERSIEEVKPNDLQGAAQCHFFAGAGVWSAAARLAGWRDDRPLRTASCPCQPFSVAGKRAGCDDPRHLWPHLFRLVRAARPAVLVGEQVAGKAGYDWFAGVSIDLEGEAFICRAVDIPACAVNAPHQRNRLFWVALADSSASGQGRRQLCGPGEGAGENRQPASGEFARSYVRDVEYAARERRGEGRPEHELERGRPASTGADTWHDLDWLDCADGKKRRTKPGLRLLVNGMAGRTDLRRLAGNSIAAPLAAEVLAALMENVT